MRFSMKQLSYLYFATATAFIAAPIIALLQLITNFLLDLKRVIKLAYFFPFDVYDGIKKAFEKNSSNQ